MQNVGGRGRGAGGVRRGTTRGSVQAATRTTAPTVRSRAVREPVQRTTVRETVTTTGSTTSRSDGAARAANVQTSTTHGVRRELPVPEPTANADGISIPRWADTTVWQDPDDTDYLVDPDVIVESQAPDDESMARVNAELTPPTGLYYYPPVDPNIQYSTVVMDSPNSSTQFPFMVVMDTPRGRYQFAANNIKIGGPGVNVSFSTSVRVPAPAHFVSHEKYVKGVTNAADLQNAKTELNRIRSRSRGRGNRSNDRSRSSNAQSSGSGNNTTTTDSGARSATSSNDDSSDERRTGTQQKKKRRRRRKSQVRIPPTSTDGNESDSRQKPDAEKLPKPGKITRRAPKSMQKVIPIQGEDTVGIRVVGYAAVITSGDKKVALVPNHILKPFIRLRGDGQVTEGDELPENEIFEMTYIEDYGGGVSTYTLPPGLKRLPALVTAFKPDQRCYLYRGSVDGAKHFELANVEVEDLGNRGLLKVVGEQRPIQQGDSGSLVYQLYDGRPYIVGVVQQKREDGSALITLVRLQDDEFVFVFEPELDAVYVSAPIHADVSRFDKTVSKTVKIDMSRFDQIETVSFGMKNAYADASTYSYMVGCYVHTDQYKFARGKAFATYVRGPHGNTLFVTSVHNGPPEVHCVSRTPCAVYGDTAFYTVHCDMHVRTIAAPYDPRRTLYVRTRDGLYDAADIDVTLGMSGLPAIQVVGRDHRVVGTLSGITKGKPVYSLLDGVYQRPNVFCVDSNDTECVDVTVGTDDFPLLTPDEMIYVDVAKRRVSVESHHGCFDTLLRFFVQVVLCPALIVLMVILMIALFSWTMPTTGAIDTDVTFCKNDRQRYVYAKFDCDVATSRCLNSRSNMCVANCEHIYNYCAGTVVKSTKCVACGITFDAPKCRVVANATGLYFNDCVTRLRSQQRDVVEISSRDFKIATAISAALNVLFFGLLILVCWHFRRWSVVPVTVLTNADAATAAAIGVTRPLIDFSLHVLAVTGTLLILLFILMKLGRKFLGLTVIAAAANGAKGVPLLIHDNVSYVSNVSTPTPVLTTTTVLLNSSLRTDVVVDRIVTSSTSAIRTSTSSLDAYVDSPVYLPLPVSRSDTDTVAEAAVYPEDDRRVVFNVDYEMPPETGSFSSARSAKQTWTTHKGNITNIYYGHKGDTSSIRTQVVNYDTGVITGSDYWQFRNPDRHFYNIRTPTFRHEDYPVIHAAVVDHVDHTRLLVAITHPICKQTLGMSIGTVCVVPKFLYKFNTTKTLVVKTDLDAFTTSLHSAHWCTFNATVLMIVSGRKTEFNYSRDACHRMYGAESFNPVPSDAPDVGALTTGVKSTYYLFCRPAVDKEQVSLVTTSNCYYGAFTAHNHSHHQVCNYFENTYWSNSLEGKFVNRSVHEGYWQTKLRVGYLYMTHHWCAYNRIETVNRYHLRMQYGFGYDRNYKHQPLRIDVDRDVDHVTVKPERLILITLHEPNGSRNFTCTTSCSFKLQHGTTRMHAGNMAPRYYGYRPVPCPQDDDTFRSRFVNAMCEHYQFYFWLYIVYMILWLIYLLYLVIVMCRRRRTHLPTAVASRNNTVRNVVRRIRTNTVGRVLAGAAVTASRIRGVKGDFTGDVGDVLTSLYSLLYAAVVLTVSLILVKHVVYVVRPRFQTTTMSSMVVLLLSYFFVSCLALKANEYDIVDDAVRLKSTRFQAVVPLNPNAPPTELVYTPTLAKGEAEPIKASIRVKSNRLVTKQTFDGLTSDFTVISSGVTQCHWGGGMGPCPSPKLGYWPQHPHVYTRCKFYPRSSVCVWGFAHCFSCNPGSDTQIYYGAEMNYDLNNPNTFATLQRITPDNVNVDVQLTVGAEKYDYTGDAKTKNDHSVGSWNVTLSAASTVAQPVNGKTTVYANELYDVPYVDFGSSSCRQFGSVMTRNVDNHSDQHIPADCMAPRTPTSKYYVVDKTQDGFNQFIADKHTPVHHSAEGCDVKVTGSKPPYRILFENCKVGTITVTFVVPGLLTQYYKEVPKIEFVSQKQVGTCRYDDDDLCSFEIAYKSEGDYTCTLMSVYPCNVSYVAVEHGRNVLNLGCYIDTDDTRFKISLCGNSYKVHSVAMVPRQHAPPNVTSLKFKMKFKSSNGWSFPSFSWLWDKSWTKWLTAIISLIFFCIICVLVFRLMMWLVRRVKLKDD